MSKKEHILTFEEEGHKYFLDGRPVPSVTQCLREVFGDPYEKVAPASREYALQQGRYVHEWTALEDTGRLLCDPKSDHILGFLMAWRMYKADHVKRIIAVERRIYSSRLMYAGALDRVEELHDPERSGLTLVDIKTGSEIYPYADLQTMGYTIAWEELNYPQKIKNRATVLLNQCGTYKIEYHDEKTDRNIWLSALSVLAWKRRNNINLEVTA